MNYSVNVKKSVNLPRDVFIAMWESSHWQLPQRRSPRRVTSNLPCAGWSSTCRGTCRERAACTRSGLGLTPFSPSLPPNVPRLRPAASAMSQGANTFAWTWEERSTIPLCRCSRDRTHCSSPCLAARWRSSPTRKVNVVESYIDCLLIRFSFKPWIDLVTFLYFVSSQDGF